MKVTALISKNNRIQVHIDGKYAFSCNENFVIDKTLFVGQEIDEDEYIVLLNQAHHNIIESKIMEYALRGRYSERELKIKVNRYSNKKFQFTPEDSFFKEIFNKLKERGYYNSKNIVKNWTDLYVSKYKGKQYILSKLLSKGFDKEEIQESLKKLDTEALDEKLESLLKKKLNSLKEEELKDKFKAKQKLTQFGISRGYGFGEIKEALNKIF